MDLKRSESDEIHHYNVAITRCHEIQNCVEEIIYFLENLQLKFATPTINCGTIKLRQRRPSAISSSHTPKIEKTLETLLRRSVHLITEISTNHILATIKIKREFDGSLKRLQVINEKHVRKQTIQATNDRIKSIFNTNSSCKCLSNC